MLYAGTALNDMQDKNYPAMDATQTESSTLSVSDEVFKLFSELIYKAAGIRLSAAKKSLLVSRLMKRLKALGINSYYDYYHRIKDNEDELVEMLNCISTNTTKFFREGHHFEYLAKHILPELFKNKQEKTIRIWSAGCSTGEEPYTIAITAREVLDKERGGRRDINIKILATDISTKVLKAAEKGVFDEEQLPDKMPFAAGKYFMKGTGENAGKIKIKDFAKEMIRFRRLNFKEPVYPFRKKFDIIFCRNVMIYFDEEMKRHVFEKFYRYLSDGGYLFLGHSETMLMQDKFKPVHVTVYKKR